MTNSSHILFYTALMDLAYKDELTGLPNRRAYEAHIKTITKATKVFADVVGLKAVNTNQGYDAGDEALKKVSEVLKGNLRATDFVCRYGGDEFVLIFKDTGESEASKIMQRINAQLFACGLELRITISVIPASAV